MRPKLHLQKFSYDTSAFPFRTRFEKLYGLSDLETIHNYYSPPHFVSEKHDSSSLLHKIFYSNFEIFLRQDYINFLSCLSKHFDEPFYFQSIPCVRFSLPGYRWLDRYHTDSDFNHPVQELNLNLAITPSAGTSALHIQESPSSSNYVHLEQLPAEYTFIDHINCIHGSTINETNSTMISLDFRIILLSDSQSAFSDKNSVNNLSKFKPGSYFSDSPYTP